MGAGGSVPTERAPLEVLMPQPDAPKYKLAVVGFQAPGGFEMNTDKSWVEGRAENARYDSVPIANGVIMAGGSCELFDYTPDDHDGFAAKVKAYDALIVRINPGHQQEVNAASVVVATCVSGPARVGFRPAK